MLKSKPLILVDTSYTSFYRFFATIKWYSFAFVDEFKDIKNDLTYDWLLNKKFIEKYEKMYLDSIVKLVKKKIFNNSDIIFCMDSPKEHLWRTELQCDYKGDRQDLSKKYNFKGTFDYTYNSIIPNIIKNNKNINSLRIDKLEADDIIAIITMHLKNENPKRQIYLISGDEDFLQLGRENIIFINYKIKKHLILTEEEALKALKNKIINGDSSDCIPGIFPKGKKINKKEIIESDEKLNEFLNNNSYSKKQYEFNKKMIDFNYIPKNYYIKVIKIFSQLIFI